MRYTNATPEPPCDPDTIAVDDIVTARVWPVKTYYNKPVIVTGRIRAIFDGCFTILSAGGYSTIRARDVQKIKRVASE
jgi:hypothetical protein